MKKIFILILIILNAVKILGQTSLLYHNNGKLLIDTTLSIDTKILDELVNFEKYILPNIYNKISYPRYCSEVSLSGDVIVKIKIQSDTIIFIEPIRYSSVELLNAVKEILNVKFLKFHLNYWKIFKKYPVEFYIPVKFQILQDTFKQDLIDKNAIVIKAFSNTNYYEKIR